MRSLAVLAAGLVLAACQLPKPPEVFTRAYVDAGGSRPKLSWDYTDIEESGVWCGLNCVAFEEIVIAWPDDLSVGYSRRVGDVEIQVRQAAVVDGRQTVTIHGRSPIREFEYSMIDCSPPVQINWLWEGGGSATGLTANGIFRSCGERED